MVQVQVLIPGGETVDLKLSEYCDVDAICALMNISPKNVFVQINGRQIDRGERVLLKEGDKIVLIPKIEAGKVRVKISPKEFYKMFQYAKFAAPNECVGFLLANKNHSEFRVDKVLLVNCEANTGYATMIDPSKVASQIADYRLIGWWHSHGSGGTFFSETDESTNSSFANLYNCILSVVVNTNGDYKAKIIAKLPYGLGLTQSDAELDFDVFTAEELEQLKNEVEQKVREIKPVVAFHGFEDEYHYDYHYPNWMWWKKNKKEAKK